MRDCDCAGCRSTPTCYARTGRGADINVGNFQAVPSVLACQGYRAPFATNVPFYRMNPLQAAIAEGTDARRTTRWGLETNLG